MRDAEFDDLEDFLAFYHIIWFMIIFAVSTDDNLDSVCHAMTEELLEMVRKALGNSVHRPADTISEKSERVDLSVRAHALTLTLQAILKALVFAFTNDESNDDIKEYVKAHTSIICSVYKIRYVNFFYLFVYKTKRSAFRIVYRINYLRNFFNHFFGIIALINTFFCTSALIFSIPSNY